MLDINPLAYHTKEKNASHINYFQWEIMLELGSHNLGETKALRALGGNPIRMSFPESILSVPQGHDIYLWT